ncbi:alpha/beta hydrolase [Rhodococcus sp. WS4]|nr:alpha/beta hydrolase [Rhodococcus sp. WS4]
MPYRSNRRTTGSSRLDGPPTRSAPTPRPTGSHWPPGPRRRQRLRMDCATGFERPPSDSGRSRHRRAPAHYRRILSDNHHHPRAPGSPYPPTIMDNTRNAHMTTHERTRIEFSSYAPAKPRDAGEVPPWFTTAVNTPHEILTVDVDGRSIAYRAWGNRNDPLLVLVHGAGANSVWWEHIAPLLVSGHRVVAPDLSGHGDSDWRDEYSLESWADEVWGIVEAEDSLDPIVLGHSMGGCIALTLAAREVPIRAIAVIDSLIEDFQPEVRRLIDEGAPVPGHRVYGTRQEVVGRFRAVPPDETQLDYITAHVAGKSVKRAAEGWTWKFDRKILRASRIAPENLRSGRCEVALLSGERGLATPAMIDEVIKRQTGSHVRVVIPDAAHHIMLEQPLALTAVLRTLVDTWSRRRADGHREPVESPVGYTSTP